MSLFFRPRQGGHAWQVGAGLFLRVLGAAAMVATLTGSVVVSCDGEPSSSTGGGGGGSNAPSSQSMGRWTPSTQDTCTKAFHDTFFVVGPDGKKYPTWHRPEETDPATNTQCSFGHDHGVDPSGSNLWQDLRAHFGDSNNNGTLDTGEVATSGVPFGYVSEQLVGSTTPRIEDHTAYKILWANNVPRTGVNGGVQVSGIDCDFLAAYNQPTSTADAFASNMFSVIHAVRCDGGTALSFKAIASVMALYRTPRSFTIDTAGTQEAVASDPVPELSPNGGTELGRRIPTDNGVFPGAFVLAGQTSTLSGLVEQWETQVRLRRTDLTDLATFLPAFRVDDPARYYSTGNAAAANSIDLCYSGLNAGGALVSDPASAATIVRQVRGLAKCTAIAPNGPATQVAVRIKVDDKLSPFRGCSRAGLFGPEVVLNTGGPATWYTTAFGERAETARFANSVKQLVAAGSNNAIVLAQSLFGQQQACSGSSVHVPN